MTNTKEITQLLMRHYFKGRYFDLHKDDIILNTIQVYEIRDGELGRQVPFDIQVAGEDEYRMFRIHLIMNSLLHIIVL